MPSFLCGLARGRIGAVRTGQWSGVKAGDLNPIIDLGVPDLAALLTPPKTPCSCRKPVITVGALITSPQVWWGSNILIIIRRIRIRMIITIRRISLFMPQRT